MLPIDSPSDVQSPQMVAEKRWRSDKGTLESGRDIDEIFGHMSSKHFVEQKNDLFLLVPGFWSKGTFSSPFLKESFSVEQIVRQKAVFSREISVKIHLKNISVIYSTFS